MMFRLTLLLFIFSVNILHSQIGEHKLIYFQETEYRAPIDVKLGYDGAEFFVESPRGMQIIQRAFTDKNLRGIDKTLLLQVLGRRSQRVELLSREDTNILFPEDFLETESSTELVLDESIINEISELLKYKSSAPYLSVSFNDHGEPVLRFQQRILGGGAFGAWAGCWAGKIAVHLIAQGLITCISLPVTIIATPMAGAAVHTALTKATLPAVEIMSIAAAAAGGIGGAVLTGPV